MKRFLDINYNRPSCYIIYFFLLGLFVVPCLIKYMLGSLNHIFWLWLILVVSCLFRIIQFHFYEIKMIELDNEKLIIHKKDRIIRLNQKDIISFRIIRDTDLIIRILTKNENIEIKIGVDESIDLLPVLFEIKPFINNCSFEGEKSFNTKKLENSANDKYLLGVIMILYMGVTIGLYQHPTIVEVENNLEKSHKIQDLITNCGHPTIFKMDKSNMVRLSWDYGNESEINRAIIKIANSEYFDEDVHFIPNDYKNYGKNKNLKKDMKWLSKIITKRLKDIPGVFKVNVSLKDSSANIMIYTSDDFEKNQIKNIVTNIIKGTTGKYNDSNINITFIKYEKVNNKLIEKHKNRCLEYCKASKKI